MAYTKINFYTRAPVEYVFDYITNPNNLSAWNGNFVENKGCPERPLMVGANWTQVSKIGGRTVEFRRKVVKYERPHRIAWEMTGFGGRMLLTFELEAQGSGTKATYIADYTVPGLLLGRLADKLLKNHARRDTTRNIAKLKAILQKGMMTKC